jgi:3-oxoacyl-[acyl-carrier protein] reductase
MTNHAEPGPHHNLIYDFSGQTVIVTGAARGIGFELARFFSSARASVYLVGFDVEDKLLWKVTDDDWDSVLAVHAGGTFRFTRACVPHFRAQGYGRIVNVTSYTGLHGITGQSNYATALAGIMGFTRNAAKELTAFGVTVDAISPNPETRMIASIPAEKKAELAATIPLGRFAEPAEMSFAVGFLAARESGYITGVVLPVDGGLSM